MFLPHNNNSNVDDVGGRKLWGVVIDMVMTLMPCGHDFTGVIPKLMKLSLLNIYSFLHVNYSFIK